MVATAYLPPPPTVPVTELPREQVRSLAHIYGHHRRHASYRFCALLPVVVRDRIYLDDGCQDPYEWAAKFGSMTRPEVDRILKLWRQIGKFDCLWRLLGEGVGTSKLERVAPHATEENAEWLAEQVKRLSKAELEELLRTMRRPAPAHGLAPARAERRIASEATRGLSVPDITSGARSVPTPDGAPSVPTADGAPSVPAAGGVPSVPAAGGAPSVPASQAWDAEPSNPAIWPETADLYASPTDDRHGQAFGMDLVSVGQGWPGKVPFARPLCRLSLEIDAVGEKRIRDLQGMYERLHGEPIGLGRLFTLLASWAILRGELPSWQEIAAMKNSTVDSYDVPSSRYEGLAQKNAARKSDSGLQLDAPGQAAPANQADSGLQLDAAGQVDSTEEADSGLQLDAEGKTGPVHQKVATVQADAVQCKDLVQTAPAGNGDATGLADAMKQTNAAERGEAVEQAEQGTPAGATPTLRSVPRRAAMERQEEQGESARAVKATSADSGISVPSRKFQPRLLEVVVSIAETGWRFIRTSLGWVPIGDGAVAGFLAPGQPVPLENLRLAAVAASKMVEGKRHRPVAVDRYLFARSGGYCEVRGCNKRAVAAHHRKRFAFDPSHHPDALVCVCDSHHGLAHKGMVKDEDRDPGGWELLQIGEEPVLTEPVRKFLAYRRSP